MSGKVSRDPKTENELARTISNFYADPLGYVMFNFPWDTDPSIQIVKLKEPWASRYPNAVYGPDAWACEFLDQLADEVKKRKFDGRTAVDPIRFSTASGHGIGKSVLVAWLIKWTMDTRPYCKGMVTAGTDNQLRTKTWAELGKWHARSLTKHWCEYSNSRGNMTLKRLGIPNLEATEWQFTALTCKEENAQAFAGQHAANSSSVYIFDEASTVPDAIFDVRDPGGLTDGSPMVFDFGNPTKKSGAFFENTVGKMKHRFITRQIDSRTVEVSNKKLAQELIDDYGITNDKVKVRVLGQFPDVGDMQFIPTDAVNEAQARPLVPDNWPPLVIGVDVARSGSNDSVIYPRVGMDARTWEPRVFAGLDTVQLTGKVIETVREFEGRGMRVAGLFVDGTGVGGGVVDQLRAFGYKVHEVQFSGKPNDPQMYKYKVDEIWGKMRDAVKTRLILPPLASKFGRRIHDELTQREYGHTLQGHIRLETKEDMQERLGGDASPDIADALALTFAQEVSPELGGFKRQRVKVNNEYNPLDPKNMP